MYLTTKQKAVTPTKNEPPPIKKKGKLIISQSAKMYKTMRRTNSKEVKEIIKNYIMEHFNYYMDDNRGQFSGDLERINNANTENYSEVCNSILTIFWDEKLKYDNRFKAGRASRFDLFVDWCSGLCSAIDTDYYYNVSAVDLLGEWLEETESEKARFDESKAEETITRLLWRELNAHATTTGILY